MSMSCMDYLELFCSQNISIDVGLVVITSISMDALYFREGDDFELTAAS